VQNPLSGKKQVDRCTFESPLPKLAGECNRLVAKLAPAEHDRGTTLALQEWDTPQTAKPEIHELIAGYLLRGFLPVSRIWGNFSRYKPCAIFTSVTKYYAGQKILAVIVCQLKKKRL
jgi:hypothetical protein